MLIKCHSLVSCVLVGVVLIKFLVVCIVLQISIFKLENQVLLLYLPMLPPGVVQLVDLMKLDCCVK